MSQDSKHTGRPALGTVLLQVAVPAVVGAIMFYYHRPVTAKVLWGISGVLLVSGLFIPPVFRLIERFGKWLGKWVANILTWVVMSFLFILVFVPGRLILKLRGQDPLCREFPGQEPTYWVPRKPVTNLDDYKRQF